MLSLKHGLIDLLRGRDNRKIDREGEKKEDR